MGKLTFRLFTVPEYEEEQEYLSKQHRRGWKFYRFILPGFYLFTRCQPENVVYRLDYNQEGLKEREEYFQMYRDCGWEHLCDVMGYSYFRKPVTDEAASEEIFNDTQSKLDMVDRVFRGRMIPCLIIFFAVICPQLVILYNFRIPESRFFFWIYVAFFALYVVMFAKFAYKKHSLKKRLR